MRCWSGRSADPAEFPGLVVQRDYDTSLPEFRGDREQSIQAGAQHRPQRRAGVGRAPRQRRCAHRAAHRAARQVTIGRQRHRLALDLHIEDNGPGVPPEIRDRIFFPLVSGRDGGSASA